MANSRVYLKSEAGGTTVVSRDTTAASGNLVLPASGNVASVDTVVTDNAIARYDGTTGKLQNSGVTIDDNNNVKANSFGAVGETKTHYISTDSNIGGTNAFRIARYANSGAFEAVPLTIDASGNVGIGTTPSAWGATKAIELGAGSLYATTNNLYFGLMQNAYFDGSLSKYKTSNAASYVEQTGGVHNWFTAPSGTAGTTATWTNVMTLSNTGNLGIGTNNPLDSLHIENTNGTKGITLNNTSGVGANGIVFKNSGTANWTVQALNDASKAFRIYDYIAGSERMRITSNGELLVGTQNGSGIAGNVSVNGNISLGSGGTGLLTNLYYNNGWKYLGNGYGWANYTEGNSGKLFWESAGNNTSGNGASATPVSRMCLDNSGNLGIGVSSTTAALDVLQKSSDSSNALTLRGYTTGTDGTRTVNMNAITSDANNWAVLNSKAASFTWSLKGSGVAMALGGGTLNIYSNISDGASMFQATNQFDNGYTSIAATGTGTYWGSAHDQVLEFVPASGGNGAISAFRGSLKFLTSDRNERMRIDSAGNLGIGVTPSAWNSIYKSIDINTGASFTGSNNATYAGMIANTYLDSSSNWRLKTTGKATWFEHYDGSFYWNTAASSSAGSVTTPINLMKLQSNGNLLVGTLTDNGVDKLQVNGSIKTVGGVDTTTYTGTFSSSASLVYSNVLEQSPILSVYKVYVGTQGSGTTVKKEFTICQSDIPANWSIVGDAYLQQYNGTITISATYGQLTVNLSNTNNSSQTSYKIVIKKIA